MFIENCIKIFFFSCSINDKRSLYTRLLELLRDSKTKLLPVPYYNIHCWNRKERENEDKMKSDHYSLSMILIFLKCLISWSTLNIYSSTDDEDAL